jgi:hypothetical protein
VIAGEEHEHGGAHPVQVLGHPRVEALDLRGRGSAVGDPGRDVRVVGHAEATDDLSHERG